MNRRIMLAATAALALTCSGLASSRAEAATQVWPQRPVRLILPLGPGSGLDFTAKLYAERLSSRWGQPVTIEHKPGGDSLPAIEAFVAAADDHTLLAAASAMFTPHPFTHPKLPYDPGRDLVPIAGLTEINTTISASAASGIDSIATLVERAKAEPGKLSWAAVTSMETLLFAAFLKETGLDMARATYKNPMEAVKDLSEGRLQVLMVAAVLAIPPAKAGKVNLLATANPMRSPFLSHVPTVSEAGHENLTFDPVIGIFGPQAMTADARRAIEADLKAVAEDPAMTGLLSNGGQSPRFMPSDVFAAAIAEESAQVKALVDLLGVNPAP